MKNPKCQTLLPWLRANLGKRCLAALTSTDARALAAAVQIIELYAFDGSPTLLVAFRSVVERMQPHCQQFAYHAIAHVLDWHDRSRLWIAAGLPVIKVQTCRYDSTKGAVAVSEA